MTRQLTIPIKVPCEVQASSALRRVAEAELRAAAGRGNAAPDEELAAGPHPLWIPASAQSAIRRRRAPAIERRIVATAGGDFTHDDALAAPDNHLSARPHARGVGGARRRVLARDGVPAIFGWAIAPA